MHTSEQVMICQNHFPSHDPCDEECGSFKRVWSTGPVLTIPDQHRQLLIGKEYDSTHSGCRDRDSSRQLAPMVHNPNSLPESQRLDVLSPTWRYVRGRPRYSELIHSCMRDVYPAFFSCIKSSIGTGSYIKNIFFIFISSLSSIWSITKLVTTLCIVLLKSWKALLII